MQQGTRDHRVPCLGMRSITDFRVQESNFWHGFFACQQPSCKPRDGLQRADLPLPSDVKRAKTSGRTAARPLELLFGARAAVLCRAGLVRSHQQGGTGRNGSVPQNVLRLLRLLSGDGLQVLTKLGSARVYDTRATVLRKK